MEVDKLKFKQLTEKLISNGSDDFLIIEAIKSYFQPKVLKNVFDYIWFGFKILKSLLIENKECSEIAGKLIIFIKKQIRKAAALKNSERLWNCLIKLWKSTKYLIEMDSNVDLSEFAAFLLKYIIDFSAENKSFSVPSKGFIIEKNFSFIDDNLSGSPSLDIALKLKSVIEPKSRKYNEVIYPIARYMFKNQNKRSNIENFLKLILLAKIIFYKSRNGSAEAKTLLEIFFTKAVLPPDFFSWAENHLNMKKPKENLKRKRIFTYILNQIDLKSTHQILYRKDNEAKCVNVEPIGNVKMLETEIQIQKDAQCDATLQQNDLKVNEKDSNVIISSSGPFIICVDKNSEHKKTQSRDLNVNLAKNKSKSDENTKPVFDVIVPLKYNIHRQDRMHLKKLRKTPSDGLKSSVGKEWAISNKESVHNVEHTEEKNRKRKRRQKKKKNINLDLECEKPSKKQKVTDKFNSGSSSMLRKRRVHSCKAQNHLPEKVKFSVDSKTSSKKLPIVSNKMEGNWIVSDIKTKNPLKTIDLLNKGNKVTGKKGNKDNIRKGNGIQKLDEKTEREKTLAHKMVISSSITDERHDEAGKRNLDASSELVEKPCKKRKGAPRHSKKFKSTGFQQRIEPKVVHELSNLKEKANTIIKEGKASDEEVNKRRESEVDEASGSDSDIVPNDIENSMFTKEETRASHQLQLKELKKKEKCQKMKVFLDKVVDSEISDSSGKLETNKTNDGKSSKCLVDNQDIGLSLYKKIDEKDEESFGESDPQNPPDEEVLPYGDDKIEDLEIVFVTIKNDLKTKFACNIKEELSLEEDSVLPELVRETKLMKKSSANTDSHPDNLFNIYSKNDDINITSYSKSKKYSIYNEVKKDKNSKTVKFSGKSNNNEQGLSSVPNNNKINSIEMGVTELDMDVDKLDSPSMISKNQLVVNEKKIEDDLVVNHDNSLIESSNAEVVCKDKQVCNDQQIHDCFVVSDEDENEKAIDGLTVNEIEILDASQSLRKSEECISQKEKEVVGTHTEDSKESEKSFTLTLDESSDDCSTNKVDRNERSIDNTKLSETKSIVKIMLSDEILKDNIETSTIESICCTNQSICNTSKEITQEQRSDKENMEDKNKNKSTTLNEVEDSNDILNAIPEKVSDALVIAENSRPDTESFNHNTETLISESVELISKNMCEASNEKSMGKNDQVNKRDENLVDNILESKSPHRKALTFEVLENSSECRSEMSVLDNPLKLQLENEENLENKENIVNNKQEESVEMSSFISSNSNSINEIPKNENHTPSCNEPSKINLTKYKSPVKRRSLVENSPVYKKSIICLTPLKVASAALSNEIIISPDVSDEENTAKSINNHIEEENIIPSTSESIVTLDQTSHEEEQIRDENDHSYSADFCSHEDKSLAKILKKNYNYKEGEHKSPIEVLELSPVSIASSESKQSPNLSGTDKLPDLLSEADQLKNSSISDLTKSSLIRSKILPDKNSSCELNKNDELASTGSTVKRKSKYSDNIETSNSELDNRLESQEELESKDKVPSPIRTRYSLRRNRNIETPEKDLMKPVRRRRNSVSSVISENEIEVVSSPSYKSRRSLAAGNLTPVRRSRRISELSVDKS